MKQGEDLWKKYCSFFEKDFLEQLEYNEKKKEEYFKKWKNTKMAKQLCPKGVEQFEDVPLTTYEDYPILHKFGREMDRLSETVPRKKGERLWDYYSRISKQVAPILNGWLPNEYSFCIKTSGTGGESRWFAHGNEVWKNNIDTCLAMATLACSKSWGETKIKKGDRILAIMAPPPFGGSCTVKVWDGIFRCVPPTHIVENITDMRKKFNMCLKAAESGRDFAFIIGMPSILHRVSKYFTNRKELYKEIYQSMKMGFGKFILFLMYLYAKQHKEYEKVSDFLSVRGLISGAVDPILYLEDLEYQYGVSPFNVFATSETMTLFMGGVERKEDLHPVLKANYLEFISSTGEVKKIDELKKGEVYESVATSFGSILTRYRTNDLLRVIDFRDDKMPIFSFESRISQVVDIYGYFKLSEHLVKKALVKLGLKSTENWAMVKEMEPKEHLHLLMEKNWDYSEEEGAKLIFKALQEIFPDFRSYISDFKIKDPREVIEIKYLKKGAFYRYTKARLNEGIPFGQIKPPHIILPEQHEISNRLKEV